MQVLTYAVEVGICRKPGQSGRDSILRARLLGDRRFERIQEDGVDTGQLTKHLHKRRKLSSCSHSHGTGEQLVLNFESGLESRMRETNSQERGEGKAFASRSNWLSSSGRKRTKAITSGLRLLWMAHSDHSCVSTSKSMWTNRLRNGVGIRVVAPRSKSRLPAAMIAQPWGNVYSPSFRSSTS